MSRARIRVGGVITWGEADIPESPYGFMEPVFQPTITRRMATPAELAIVAARDEAEGYLKSLPKPPTIIGAFRNTEREQASRLRGVARSHHAKVPKVIRKRGQTAAAIRKRDIRAALVLEAMDRLGDDKAAVGRELGLAVNAVSIVVKWARVRSAA